MDGIATSSGFPPLFQPFFDLSPFEHINAIKTEPFEEDWWQEEQLNVEWNEDPIQVEPLLPYNPVCPTHSPEPALQIYADKVLSGNSAPNPLDRYPTPPLSNGDDVTFQGGSGGLGMSSCDNDGAQKLQHPCRHCPDSFQTVQELENHARLLSHRTFLCKEEGCGRDFCRRDTYVRHKRVHKIRTTHSCHICSKLYNRKEALQIHLDQAHPRRASPLEFGRNSPHHSGIPLSAGSTAVPSITAALRSILGQNSLAVQLIDARLDSASRIELAHNLARLALFPPEHLTPHVREQLRAI